MTLRERSIVVVIGLGLVGALLGPTIAWRDLMPAWLAEGPGRVEGAGLYAAAQAAGNLPPVADAGPDWTAAIGERVVLDGTGSTDPKGMVLEFSWRIHESSAPGGQLIDPTAVKPTFIVGDPGDAGPYILELTVSESNRVSLPDTVYISTKNSAPVADAGADQRILDTPSMVRLDGSGSTDVDGQLLTYAWTVQAPTGGATLDSANTVRPTLNLPFDGTYVVQLEVTDESGAAASDTVVISTEGVAPVARAGRDVTSNCTT